MMETRRFSKDELDVKETLFSGQVFKVTENENGFFLQSGDKIAFFRDADTFWDLESETLAYFEYYLCLDFDYEKVKKRVTDPFALEAIESCANLKILRQDPFETVITFIVSANNNIKRIRKILFAISKSYGKKMEFLGEEFFAFPTPQELSKAAVDDLKALGLGYRAGYIFETVREISQGFSLNIDEMTSKDANKHLCQLMGIGEKVADCILLFGYGRYDVFPVDTWIEKLYREDYHGTDKSRKEIRKFFIDLFGEYAGIVQQYLFFYKRLKEAKK